MPGAGGLPGQPGAPGQPGGPDGPPNVDPPAAPVIGPLATKIMAEQQMVGMLGERLKDANERLAELKKLLDSARKAARAAEQLEDSAEARSNYSAARAYQEYAAVPESLREYADGLEHLAPGLRDSSSVTGKADADAYSAAATLADTAAKTLVAAQKAVSAAAANAAKLKREYEQRLKALQMLTARNAAELRRAQKAVDDYAAGVDYDPGGAVKGYKAHPKALKAVKYALAQLGKPYRWGDEGPDRFDCSGLVWAAYQHAGVNLTARTARAQYYTTRKVAAGHLLPGDLVFFGKDRSNPESIHHVGIYIGKGKIVHAPTAGDVVKISPIWWWEYFGATRVVPAVKASPGKDPKPDPKPTPKPTKPSPKPSPSWTNSPLPTTPPPSSKPPASPSASANPSPGDPPSGEPDSSEAPKSASPSASGAAGDDSTSADAPASSGGSGSRESSASPCPSPSASPSASPSPTPSASPSASPSPNCASSEHTTEKTSDDGSGGTGGWYAYPLEPKPATLSGRRRTRAGRP